jgi:hypothetical protein
MNNAAEEFQGQPSETLDAESQRREPQMGQKFAKRGRGPVEVPQSLRLVSTELEAIAVLAFEITNGSKDEYARARADAILEHVVDARAMQTILFADWRELTARAEGGKSASQTRQKVAAAGESGEAP